jgi:NitT/TauT family transport system substrate-binding protein
VNNRQATWSRREFLIGLALAGTSGFLGEWPDQAAAEPPPETTSLRLIQRTGVDCISPQHIAEELLITEGFTDTQYVRTSGSAAEVERALATGEAHITMHYAPALIAQIDRGDPVVILAGGHVGCYELFATRVRSIRDLKGRPVGVPALASVPWQLLGIMMAHVGVDRKDMNFVAVPLADQARQLGEGKIDAFLAFPPTSHELREKRLGHVIFNSAVDRPFSQYFCCVVAGNREFVSKHPIATKRAVRAILKSADMCALEPGRVAQALVERGFTQRYDYALQTLRSLPYGRWREFDAEDSVRFYSLRLHEAGMIKSTANRILARGTDWRFLTELKKELKG